MTRRGEIEWKRSEDDRYIQEVQEKNYLEWWLQRNVGYYMQIGGDPGAYTIREYEAVDPELGGFYSSTEFAGKTLKDVRRTIRRWFRPGRNYPS